MMLLTVVGLLLVIGFGFCLWSGYQWLAVLWGGALAALAMGLVSLLLAALVGWLAWRNVR